MTYPMDGLAVIAPILFMVMIIGFPLIGLAVGWKRALYWGGGNFVFYVIGLIVWKCAGGAIGGAIANILKQIEALKEVDPTKLATSVAAPIFFVIVLLIANLLLLINYYAWFKRVSGIKKDIQAKRALKAAKKEYKEKGKKVPEVLTAKTKDGTKVTQKAFGVRAGHKLIGLASMEMLMLPVTLSLTNAVFFTTTTSATRAKNGFANGLYNSLNRTDANMSWFSYYGGTSGDDFDALLTAASLMSNDEKVNVTYYNYETGQVETIETPTVVELVTNEIPTTFGNISDSVGEITQDKIQEKIEAGKTDEEIGKEIQTTIKPINDLASQWNALVTNYPLQAAAMINSSSLMDIVKQLLEHSNGESEGKITITKEILKQVFGEVWEEESGIYFKIRDQYIDAVKEQKDWLEITIDFTANTEHTIKFKMSTIETLKVKASTISNIKDIVYSFIEFDDDVTANDKVQFDARVDEVIGLILA